MRFAKIGSRILSQFLGRSVVPHAFWWIVKFSNTALLFVGDLNIVDVATLTEFVDKIFERGRPLHGALVPSYVGVSEHGAADNGDLSSSGANLAQTLQDAHGMEIGALPHPIDARWAQHNAISLQSVADLIYKNSKFDIQKIGI